MLRDQIKLAETELESERVNLKKLDEVSNSKLQDKLTDLRRELRRYEHNLSCLCCDSIKPEMLMMVCGHNICSICLSLHSHNHTRSGIRCDVCALESKVTQL